MPPFLGDLFAWIPSLRYTMSAASMYLHPQAGEGDYGGMQKVMVDAPRGSWEALRGPKWRRLGGHYLEAENCNHTLIFHQDWISIHEKKCEIQAATLNKQGLQGRNSKDKHCRKLLKWSPNILQKVT